MNFDLDEILRQNADESLREATKAIYDLYKSFCEVGFTEEQAMQIITSIIGGLTGKVQR